MPESTPLCNTIITFLKGDMNCLDELKTKFYRALSDSVHLFAPDKEGNRFIVIADGDGAGIQHTLKQVLSDFYEKTQLRSIYKKIQECDAPPLVPLDDDHKKFLKDSFTIKVYSRDDYSSESIEKMLFELVAPDSTGEGDGNDEETAPFLFNLIGAKNHEAYYVCKLTAICRAYCICNYTEDEGSPGDVRLLQPFPKHCKLSSNEMKILNILKKVYHGLEEKSIIEGVEEKYLCSHELTERAGISESNPDRALKRIFDQGLVSRKKISVKPHDRSYQYTITDDGLFMIKYIETGNSKKRSRLQNNCI